MAYDWTWLRKLGVGYYPEIRSFSSSSGSFRAKQGHIQKVEKEFRGGDRTFFSVEMSTSLLLFMQDGIWSPVDCNNVELRNEPFSPSSVVHNDSFDLITISHVLYYVENVEERKAIYEKFADLLAENGAAFILQVSEDDADNLSGQSRLMMDVTRKILIKEDTCLVSPGDFTVTADLIHQEITSLECKNIKVEYIGPYWFKVCVVSLFVDIHNTLDKANADEFADNDA